MGKEKIHYHIMMMTVMVSLTGSGSSQFCCAPRTGHWQVANCDSASDEYTGTAWLYCLNNNVTNSTAGGHWYARRSRTPGLEWRDGAYPQTGPRPIGL